MSVSAIIDQTTVTEDAEFEIGLGGQGKQAYRFVLWGSLFSCFRESGSYRMGVALGTR